MASGGITRRIDEQWARVSGRLRAEIGETAYQSWLKPMTVREAENGQIKISVPTRFMRDWVVAHYADRLTALWSGEDSEIQGIEVVVQPDRPLIPAGAPKPKLPVRAPGTG